jgi:alpha-1,2-mannosyltransferase
MSVLQKTLLMLCAMCLVTQACANLIKYFYEVSAASPFGGDFIGFWNAAHRVRHSDIAAIYDPDGWRSILSTATGPVTISWFVYPPVALFGLWPLGNASYNQAVLAWSLVPLALFFPLIVFLAKRSGLSIGGNFAGEDSWSRAQAYAVLIAFSLPFLSANLFSGQTGTIIAVFFLGAAYFWPSRPILTGICVGLLIIKPQMGLLMPFALIASRQWRTVIAAAVTVFCLIVLSTLWLGTAIWTDYFRMGQLFGQLIGGGYDGIKQLAISPYVSLKSVGMPTAAAGLLQLVVSVTVLIVVVAGFWQRKSNRKASGVEEGQLDLRLALLAAGTLLATPYALSYDTPLLMLSVIPVLARSWRHGWDGIELASLTALLMLPYAQPVAVGIHIPFAFLSLLFWFGVICRRVFKERLAKPIGLQIPVPAAAA